MTKVNIRLTDEGAGFEGTDEAGRVIRFDTSPEHGGLDKGVRPMHTLLLALGSCSGVDIMSIMKKKRVQPGSFGMTIEGEREAEQHFSLWRRVHITYRMTGAVTEEQLRQAAGLSVEKYCSVAETLRRAGCIITWNAEIHA